MTMLSTKEITSDIIDDGVTLNGAVTNVSSLDKNLDLFFLIGASRGNTLMPLFKQAYKENPELASRILLWARDVRGGAGERQMFRDLLSDLIKVDTVLAERILVKIPEIGRWDDVFVYFNTSLEHEAIRLIAEALLDKNALCAKWMPRQTNVKKSDYRAKKIRDYLKMSPAQYRKLLSSTTDVVEQKMCAKQFDMIDFGQVPSIASSRYRNAFSRNAPEKYSQYLERVQGGQNKINAGAIYPCDIIRHARVGGSTTADLQWKALPNYLEGIDERMIVVADTSGSMMHNHPGKSNISPIDVAISLALYCAERINGVFKDCFITFSENPNVHKIVGNTLIEKINNISSVGWGFSTEINKVFDLLINTAVQYSIPENQMPTKIVIVSDMEFSYCVKESTNISAYDYIVDKYKANGYSVPDVIFWNVNGRMGNVPVSKDSSGVALVSGYSPTLLESVLGCLKFDPMSVMLEVLNKPRYDF